MPRLEIGFKTWLGGLILALGIANLVLGVLASTPMSIVLGVILSLLGVLWLVGKPIVVEPHEIQLKNLLGMTLRRYPVTRPGDVDIPTGKYLRHVPTGKKVVSLAMIDRADADRLRERFGAGTPGGPGEATGPHADA